MSFTIKLVLKNESAFAMLHTIYLVDTRGELEQSRCRQIGIKFVLNVPLRGASVVQIYLYQQILLRLCGS
jgi:hypothetical protein